MAEPVEAESDLGERYTSLPFPPLTKAHILNCSFHSWHPRYRSITPKARLIPLTPPFVEYLKSDGIVLPDDNPQQMTWSDDDSGVYSSAEADDQTDHDDEEQEDIAADWRDVHEAIRSNIAELGGKVVPKLNWSAPKDATWISTTSSLECQSPDDIYLLLKSSDFVSHDLGHAFDDTVDPEGDPKLTQDDIPYHLVLRKYVELNPSLEFRCFVRRRKLIAICQRELNHFEYLFKMKDQLRDVIEKFFEEKLKDTFFDESFAFDVYIPPPHKRVWLIDINPWAQRTDPLLFSWLELLTMSDEPLVEDSEDSEEEDPGDEDDVEELDERPIFRLIRKDDPEAYNFSTQQYSAHKLPKDVVDASRSGGSQLRDFATQWKELMEQANNQKAEDSDDE